MANIRDFVLNSNGLNNREIVKESDNTILVKETNKDYKEYLVYKIENELVANYMQTESLEDAMIKFELLNSNPNLLIIKEDPVGYPNNSSVVAFSPKETAKDGFIVYYEILNDKLTKQEALISFAQSCYSVINTEKSAELKEKITQYYPNVKFGEKLHLKNLTLPESEAEKVEFIGLNKEDLETLGFTKARSLSLGDEYQIESSPENINKLTELGFGKTFGSEGLTTSFATFRCDNNEHPDYGKMFISVRENIFAQTSLREGDLNKIKSLEEAKNLVEEHQKEIKTDTNLKVK